jgi:hypothetical protein
MIGEIGEIGEIREIRDSELSDATRRSGVARFTLGALIGAR